jgi:hypothetical protein
MVCLIYIGVKVPLLEESADKSNRNNDAGHFFVKEGKPPSEVDTSVGYHWHEGAAFSNISGAYNNGWRGFLRIYVYNECLCQ